MHEAEDSDEKVSYYVQVSVTSSIGQVVGLSAYQTVCKPEEEEAVEEATTIVDTTTADIIMITIMAVMDGMIMADVGAVAGEEEEEEEGKQKVLGLSHSNDYWSGGYRRGGGGLGLLGLLGGGLFGFRQPYYSQPYYYNQQPYYYQQRAGCEVQQFMGMAGMQQQFYCVCNGAATYQYGGCMNYGYG
ncbi:hypothetical protein GCK32_012542 [Trichostrongylus colubriformis]|uniref:Uncharacterized protein n=1 Tax=Trichostrongylus colubriformis TaxID=6319 RepID=A0AAN8F3S5_TRICO